MKLRGQMKRANNQKGFTLVELMVVVVIIGILAAVAVPTYGNITAKAKDKANDANIRILESAIQAYLSENEGEYENLTLAEDGAIAGTGVTVGSLIPKYIKDMPKSPYDSTNTNSYTKAKDGNVEVNK